MRRLLVIIIASALISCETEDVPTVIESFPAVLVYDTMHFLENEVYDLTGRLYGYDEEFDNFGIRPIWFYDSLKILDGSTAVVYSLIKRFDYNSTKYDTLDLTILADRLITVPRYLPDTILVFDPENIMSFTFCSDPVKIRQSAMRTYVGSGDHFILSQFAVRFFRKSMVPWGYDYYDMIGQNSLNTVDRESLLQLLDAGETLSIISYELHFNLK